MVNLSTCNDTLAHQSVDGETKISGNLSIHGVGLIVAAFFGLVAVILSFFLMYMHATHYLKPWEQKHIIRILFMVPIYAVVSFLGFYKYNHYVYFNVIRDCYDAFAISSFFALLCSYIQPDLHAQKDYFRKTNPKNWLPPVNLFQRCCGAGRKTVPKRTWRQCFMGGDVGPEKGPWRVPRSGLTWFNIIWLCIFQYCFTRVFFTFVSVVSEATGRYCVESLSPAFAHVWTEVISAVSVSIAMFCLIQFYYQIHLDIEEYRPFLKLLSIKLVIFFVFWQTIILSFLNSSGAIKASDKIFQPDITVGIPALLIDIEMALFAFLHIWAYPWQAYNIHSPAVAASETGAGYTLSRENYKGGPLGVYAFMDAFNPWDIVKAIGRGFRWAFVGRRKREMDVSYQPGYGNAAGGPDGSGRGGTPLKDTTAAASVGLGRKGGAYEPLDGRGTETEDEGSYEAYRGRGQHNHNPNLYGGAGAGFAPSGINANSTEAFATAPLGRPGVGAQIPVQGGGEGVGTDTNRTTRFPGPAAPGRNPGYTPAPVYGAPTGYDGQPGITMPDESQYGRNLR